MADGGSDGLPLWDHRNEAEQELIVDDTSSGSMYTKLQSAGVVLRRNLNMNTLMPQLMSLHVFTPEEEEMIMFNAPRAITVDRLLKQLRMGVSWQYHALWRSCILTGQKHLLREVGLDPQNYILTPSEVSVFSQDSRSPYPKQLSPQLIEGIRSHAVSCVRNLMRRNLYDISKGKKWIDTTTCYIDVGTQHESRHGDLNEVPEKEIMVAFPTDKGPPCVIRIYGHPGTGKTALLQHIVYDWSEEFLRRLSQLEPMDDLHTAMVYVPARAITGTVEEAILDNLRCRDEHKPALSQHIKAGNNTAVMLDAVDEVRNEIVMENIRKFVKRRQNTGDGPCVIITSRTDLCDIDATTFDRFLMVKGFNEQQALLYIEAFFTEERVQEVIDYVKGHRRQLYGITTNPLRLHVFCALVDERELVLDDNDDFCILRLFDLLVQFLLKREEKDVDEAKKVSEQDLQRFCKMCFTALLKGVRQFTQAFLKKFDIHKGCLIFFNRKSENKLFSAETYSFPHEVMFEYFSGRYFGGLPASQKESLLFAICSRPELRNLQRILFEVIQQQEVEQTAILQTMLRAIIILNFAHDVERDKTISGRLKRFRLPKKDLQSTIQDKVLAFCDEVTPSSRANIADERLLWNKTEKADKLWMEINQLFDTQPNEMKDYVQLGKGVFGHVTECISVCPPEQRDFYYCTLLKPLLPYKYRGNDRTWIHCIVPIGKTRYIEITRYPRGQGYRLELPAWCPSDAAEALPLCWEHLDMMFTTVSLHVSPNYGIWGEPPEYLYSVAEWAKLTEEMKEMDDFEIQMDDSTPILPLLIAWPISYSCRINGGMAKLEELANEVESSRGYLLSDTNIFVPSDKSDHELEYMRKSVEGVKAMFSNYSYIGSSGQKYVFKGDTQKEKT